MGSLWHANLWANRAKLCANTAQSYGQASKIFFNEINVGNVAL